MSKKELRSYMTTPLIAIISICVFFVSGCNQDDWEIDSDKCVFIEHHINTYGELIEGNYVEGPGVDTPTFSFDSVNGILSGSIGFELSNSLKVIYGNGISYWGVAGSGVSTRLLGIYKLPYQQENFKITQVETNGTIHLQYNDSIIVLKSNEEWVNISTYIDIQNNAGEIAKAKLTTTDRFVNYGIIEKSNVRK